MSFDKLNTNERVDNLGNPEISYETERSRVRAMPPVNKEHFSNDYLNRTELNNKDFQRGAVEENTDANRRTINHELRNHQQQMRSKMNQAIEARKEQYDKLSSIPKKGGITLAPLNVVAANDELKQKPKRQQAQPIPDKLSVVESFTSPGKVLGQQESLLFNNDTVSTRVLKHDHTREFKQNYRKYVEEKRQREQRLDRMNVANDDPIRSNNLDFNLPSGGGGGNGNKNTISRPGGFGVLPKDTVGNQLTNPHESDRYNKPMQTVVTIDSRDRDKSRYPNANQFKISLGRQFRQVKRVVIQSTEFPNTDLMIRDDPQEALFQRNRIVLDCGEVLNDANNHLYWYNAEDAIRDDIYDCLFYTADITPGNYTGESLAEEIEEKVGQVNRFIGGTPHQFIVEIDEQTNIVRFLSVQSVTLALNPISTENGTNVITVEQTNHPFSPGDRVTITNSNAVGGITSDAINREHTIVSTTTNTYTIRVTQIANSTATGGGANVLSGENKPIKLLFSNIDTFGSLLGFPQQDSSEQIATPIEFIDIQPQNLATLMESEPGTLPARIMSTDHGLIPGDEILITNTDTIPNINGIQTVTKVITEDEFEIGEVIKVVNNQTSTVNTVLGTICETPDEFATEVTGLSTSTEGNIVTSIPHQFSIGDLVFISNVIGGLTIGGNNINDVQTVSSNINLTTFDILDGILYEGTDFSNAFVFKTDSMSSNPISGIIPQNNGVIEPADTVPIFTGSQTPNFVFFTNMGNTTPTLESNIFEVSFYSTNTGRFDLTTPITDVVSQFATQSYIRSRDSDLRTIVDAFPASNGTFRLDADHELMSGNTIYVRSLIPSITTSEPRITPDITGVLTINTIFDNQNFDTTQTINTSIFDTGDIAFVKTDDKTPTRIQNIYPYSNNYLAKDINECRFPECVLCDDSIIYIFDSYLRIASNTDANIAMSEEISSNTLVNGLRVVNQVFSGQSKNFTDIFDIKNVVLDVLPLPVARVTKPFAASPTHTVLFFYDFGSIFNVSAVTTGTVVFGGTSQLGLNVGVTYNFTFTNGSTNVNTIVITNGSSSIAVDSMPLTSGTFYISEMTINEDFESPLGNCVIFDTSGASNGVNGTLGQATFTQSTADFVVANTFPRFHGLGSGDKIFITEINVSDPTFPFFVTNVDINGFEQELTIFSTTHDIQLEVNDPLNNGFDVQILDGANTVCVNGFGIPPPPFVATIGGLNVFLTNFAGNVTGDVTYPVNKIGTSSIGNNGVGCGATYPGFPIPVYAFEGALPQPSVIQTIIPPTGGSINIISTLKSDAVFTNLTFGVNVINQFEFQVVFPNPITGIQGDFEYHKICGDVVPIKSFFPNSWPGMIESQNNGLPNDETENIYIGKALEAATTPAPIDTFAIPDPINGVLGNAKNSLSPFHFFDDPLNFHFITSTDLFDRPIVVEEINASDAEFVRISSGADEFLGNIQEITSSNNGLIETANIHSFSGGETLFFLDNVNINNEVANDLRSGFFQVGEVDPVNPNRFSLTVPITKVGTGNITDMGTGNFFFTYQNESLNVIQNVNSNTNATFISETEHGFDLVTPTQIFITDNEVAPLNNAFTNAFAFRNPAPLPSTTQFTTDIIVNTIDIDPSSTILDPDNDVDIINTNNALLPQLNGMRWVRSLGLGQIPIVDVNVDSRGTLSPVKPGLSVGDFVNIVSTQPTTQDLNGVHQVSYIDANVGAFFELADVTITDTGGAIDAGNIQYFCVESANSCATINSITEGQCPTTIRATNHGFEIGSTINVAIIGTETVPPIDVANANVIVGATVLDADEILLPEFSSNSSNVCVEEVTNRINLFIEQQGLISKEILSTNCGVSTFTPDPMNGVTIVTTPSRTNLKTRSMFEITTSTPIPGGASTISTILPAGVSQLPFNNGDIVLISGHLNGTPHIDGMYKVFNVNINEFSITSLTSPFSTGGTGGFVTGPSEPTVPGHGLFTGDTIIFTHVMSEPDIHHIPFEVTVISPTEFTIPIVLTSVDNRCPGEWCSNVIDMEFPNHGFVDGDTFFLYNAQNTGGILPDNINTMHGDKRMNVPTKIEQQTQKTVRVIDENNIQFKTNNIFPFARTTSGGFTVCVSSNNHTIGETDGGRPLRNHGFDAIQTNQDCLGSTLNFVNLNNESYVLLVSDVLNHIINTGPVRNIFAKLQLDAPPGDVAYNSFVTIERLFDSPIVRFDEVDFEIRRRDGKLFDLRGRDWSISLLIEEYRHILRNAEISSRTGIADRGSVSAQGFIESTISAENPEQNVLSPTQFTEVTNLSQRVNVPNQPTN